MKLDTKSLVLMAVAIVINVVVGQIAVWIKRGDVVVAPFILSCGTCPSCRAGQQTVCSDQRLPGFIEPGAFAEYVAVPRDFNLARLPEGMSPTLAAGLGCRVTTAWHALTGRTSSARRGRNSGRPQQ